MNPRSAAHLLVFLSGGAGLAHQVLWTRRLVDVLGASADTFARVVGAFFVGLAVGGAISAWRPAKSENGWRRVAGAEFAVALLALPVWLAVPLAESGRALMPAPLLKILLPLVLVLPPAMAMGLVLPAVVAVTARRADPLPLYLANTLGGVAGIAGIVLVALPAWGTLAAGLATCSLNLFLAAAAWTMSRTDHPAATPAGSFTEPDDEPPACPRLVAFGSGFLVLGLEVGFQHQFAQVTINSFFSGALVLSFVLLALVGAGALTGTLVLRLGSTRRALSWTLWATVVLLVLEPIVFLTLRPGLRMISYQLAPAAYYLRVVLLAGAVILPAGFAAGFSFPLLLRSLRRLRDHRRELAVLLAINGLGGWMGAECLQQVLLPRSGLWGVMGWLAGLGLVLWYCNRTTSPVATHRKLAGAVALLALLVLGEVVALRLPQVSPVAGDQVIALTAAREGVVATVRGDTHDWRMIFNNTYTLGGSRAQFNQERQAHLPLLLHGEPRSVALLGVATGSTTAGAALHPEVESIEAVELSARVLDMARQHFGAFNREVFRDPRVRIRHEDARWVMTTQPAAYDVVIGDLFMPWRTGEGRLFSAEHFAAVHRALKPDGLFCQWLPLFQLTRPQFDTITRTFLGEFPEAFLVRGDFYTELPILGLVGGRSLGSLDWTRVERACERLRVAEKVTDPLARHVEGVAMTILGPIPASSPGPINTLGNGWIEWDAGRNIVGLQEPWFIGIPCAEFIRDQQRAGAALLPPALQPAQDSGQFFLTLEIAATLNLPVLPNLRSQMITRLPASLRDDPGADWRQWPMRLKPAPGVRRVPLHVPSP